MSLLLLLLFDDVHTASTCHFLEPFLLISKRSPIISNMSESSQDRDAAAPAPPPHLHARDHEEVDEAADNDDESTPFLPPSPSEDHAPPPASSSFSFPRALRILTVLALTFSILTLVSLFATAVARSVGPVSFNLPWPTKDGLNGVLAPVSGLSFLFRLASHNTLFNINSPFSYCSSCTTGNFLPPLLSIQYPPPTFPQTSSAPCHQLDRRYRDCLFCHHLWRRRSIGLAGRFGRLVLLPRR